MAAGRGALGRGRTDGSLPSKDGSLVASPENEDASARRKAYAALHLATLAKRFRQLAAPRIADSSLERLARDVQGGAGDASTQRLLAARSASALAEVVAHLPEKLDADRCDCCVEGLVAALTHSADVWPDRASFCASRGEGVITSLCRSRRARQDDAQTARLRPEAARARRQRRHAARVPNAVRAICERLRRTSRTSRTNSNRASVWRFGRCGDGGGRAGRRRARGAAHGDIGWFNVDCFGLRPSRERGAAFCPRMSVSSRLPSFDAGAGHGRQPHAARSWL